MLRICTPRKFYKFSRNDRNGKQIKCNNAMVSFLNCERNKCFYARLKPKHARIARFF
ncbi:hypothetical protein [Helicobacter rodentium]|uniref:hypothetical protein n=1 Tax=Helicobacter rodentium TaxID=59617 RepID=UPI002353110A|nr:hypothetical protein [Helicobacter rodentium]